jgi:hypothetical protein
MSALASEMPNADEVRIHLESESPAIEAWAARHGWEVSVDLEGLTLLALTSHPALPDVKVRFRADLSNYPRHPPRWECIDEKGATPGSAFPTPWVVANGQPSSIFHSNRFICAPWSADAYAENGGPHNDWVSMINWRDVPSPTSQAHTIADMLSALELHLQASPGMFA